MKSYNFKKHGDLVNNMRLNKKSRLLMYIYERCIIALEKAIEYDDAKRIINIIDNFSLEIYKETGVWFDTFDYYDKYGDNLNGYVSLMIYRINKALS